MFNLMNSNHLKQDLLTAGKTLTEIKLITDPQNITEIINRYTENLRTQLSKIIKLKTVSFNEDTLSYYLNSQDELEVDLAQNCKKYFKEYALIVLRFHDQIAAWQNETNGENYRNLVARLDYTRTNIHNACLNDINIINRLAKTDQLSSFINIKIDNPTRTDFGQTIIKARCENVLNYLTNINI